MTLERAAHVFAQGFAFTRSFTHPFLVEKCNGLTVMRDAPRKNGDRRNSEYIVVGKTPSQGVSALSKVNLGRDAVCVICDLTEDLDAARDAYKKAGLRLLRSEPLFVADPKKAPDFKAPLPVLRVTDQDLADRVNRTMRTRQVLPEHLEREDTLRCYAAINGKSVVGIVKSIPVGEDAWVSNLFVDKAMRGKGIGRALMSTMLKDDANHGVANSVLLASTAGARLYPHVGYERIGTLLLFVQRHRRI